MPNRCAAPTQNSICRRLPRKQRWRAALRQRYYRSRHRENWKSGCRTFQCRISSFRDDGFGNTFGVARPSSVVYAADAGKWNFAWALHTGLAYKVTPNVTVELGYSYVNLGDATTGYNSNFGGGPTAQFPWTMKDITSHDLTLGVRWN